jgi:hypothetical protein
MSFTTILTGGADTLWVTLNVEALNAMSRALVGGCELFGVGRATRRAWSSCAGQDGRSPASI